MFLFHDTAEENPAKNATKFISILVQSFKTMRYTHNTQKRYSDKQDDKPSCNINMIVNMIIFPKTVE